MRLRTTAFPTLRLVAMPSRSDGLAAVAAVVRWRMPSSGVVTPGAALNAAKSDGVRNMSMLLGRVRAALIRR